MTDFRTFSGRPGMPLATQREPRNPSKIEILLNKVVPNMNVRQFLCTNTVFTQFARFCIDFPRKNDEKSKTKRYILFTANLVFFNIATLTKHCILQYESHFFIFCVFARFFKRIEKKCSKIQFTIFPSKITKKSSPGTVLGSNGPELTSEK